MAITDELKSGNFSLYGQWYVSYGITLSIPTVSPTCAKTLSSLLSCSALILFGILSFSIGWSLIGWIIAFLLVFIEIPLCLKCCPTSQKFDDFLTKFHNSYFRAGAYLVFCILMWIAVGVGHRNLQAISAILLTLATLAYGLAAVKGQAPASSTITGGTGVSTIV
ncbi:Golgi apparatus membrane protein tvp18 [Mortierella alpina]|nr:Golgi apparatus membrane protein tvp18 [Mortierella alpina]